MLRLFGGKTLVKRVCCEWQLAAQQSARRQYTSRTPLSLHKVSSENSVPAAAAVGAAGSKAAHHSATFSAGNAAALDAEAQEQIKVSEAIGEENFEENTRILKQMAMRGLRAFLVAAVGLGTFAFAMKRKRAQLAAADAAKAPDGADGDASEGAAEDDAALSLLRSVAVPRTDPTSKRPKLVEVTTKEEEELARLLSRQKPHAPVETDPTQRYLEEMRGLGFDVDTLEEELERERMSSANKR